MKSALLTLAFFACLGSAQASETRFVNLINEITAAVTQPTSLEVRGRDGSTRVGGCTKSGKGSRYVGGYTSSGKGRRR